MVNKKIHIPGSHNQSEEVAMLRKPTTMPTCFFVENLLC